MDHFEDWFYGQLERENLWTPPELHDLVDRLRHWYRQGEGKWGVRENQQMQEPGMTPVFVVGRGEVEIDTEPTREKADAVMRALTAWEAK